jgi:hypothetical protein
MESLVVPVRARGPAQAAELDGGGDVQGDAGEEDDANDP